MIDQKYKGVDLMKAATSFGPNMRKILVDNLCLDY